jgi:NADH-quinone oxidoreductase subunit C
MKNTSILLNSFISEDRRFTQYLTTVFQPLIVYSIKGELYCKVDRKSSKQFLIFLKYHTNTLYKQLIDLYGVDYGEKIQRFEICYNLLSILFHRRLNVTLVLSEKQKVQSVCDLYPNSSWYEREVYDLFGFIFQGNNDFRRILTDYGFKGHPMRKDFPLTGYIELRYDDFGKRIRYERVTLSQDYRIFTLKNPWSIKKINF